MKIRTEDLVAKLAFALCERLGESRYQLWFANKTKFTLQEQQLIVGVPNLFAQDWLGKTFARDVVEVASELLGEPITVSFVIDAELFQAARRREDAGTPSAPVAEAKPSRPSTPTRGRRWRRLDDLVVGACNRVAHASALSLIEAPEEHPCPLVLHGPVGTGKTHFLEGMHAALQEQNPGWRVCYVTAEEFTHRFVQAMHLGKLAGFRKQYRDCDALLVDDLHFLARKQATQEEFLHTLDALQSGQRPIALTCDSHPRLADHFLPELADRLVGGAVWSLTPPDRSTRMLLLRTKSRKMPLSDAVVDFLADHLHGNVRELEGAIHSLQHLSKITGRSIDIELAKEALGDLLRHSVRMVQIVDVEQAVCVVLGIGADILKGKQRGWMASHPRMLAMYLARKHTSATYHEIGKHFGGRNHSTVVASEKKVRDWLTQGSTLPFGQRPVPVRDLLERIEQTLWA